MASICIYFQVHQPYRIKHYRIFDIGDNHKYFDDDSETDVNNKRILDRVVEKCYLPANEILLDLLERHPEFKFSFSITGVLLEQLEKSYPEVLRSFQDLVNTGKVEILGETYHHSLAFLFSRREFRRQIGMQNDKIKKLFGVQPQIFRNTELIYNNELAEEIEYLGFKGIITEGADAILEDQPGPNYVYTAVGTSMPMLLKDYDLSDDIAFRFANYADQGTPLTPHKFANKLTKKNKDGEIVNLFLDYETFGEHHWEDTGIFRFLDQLPQAMLNGYHHHFVTPSEAVSQLTPVAELSVPHFISWADIDRDISAWLSNSMQHEALEKLYELEEKILNTKDEKLIGDWRRLQSSDHFYYMCTKWFADGDVHRYFSPYESPYEAFIAFMNVLKDVQMRLGEYTLPSMESESETDDAEELITAQHLAVQAFPSS